MKTSCGTLLYRIVDQTVEVLIVHPSGNYNRHAPWSIPKGLPNKDESHEDAARRETFEETSIVAGELQAIGSIKYTKSRKEIFCFAGPVPDDAQPTCGSWEVDRAELVTADQARQLLHPEQVAFIDRLEELLT